MNSIMQEYAGWVHIDELSKHDGRGLAVDRMPARKPEEHWYSCVNRAGSAKIDAVNGSDLDIKRTSNKVNNHG
jgi:hypothetical protein